ncbi:MAG: DUF669 domain-containing protein [Oscillospiraceae bacterium]|nr:DUF669 domain-containing protein [Oscillospiraceae bacterium]
MAFKIDPNATGTSYSLKPEGYYEVIIESAYIEDYTRADGTKTQRIKLKYIIRNDVDQRYKNACIFHDIWQRREEKLTELDRTVENFHYDNLMGLANALPLSKEKEYANVAELVADFAGKPVKAHLYHEAGTNGKTYEKIDEHKPTDFPNVAHKAKTPVSADTYAAPPAQSFAASAAAAADVSDDDDYPF